MQNTLMSHNPTQSHTPPTRQRQLKGKVLVVDDEDLIIKWLERKLRVAGMDVSVAKDTESAKQLLANGKFHLLITDVFLDRPTGGIELMKSAEAAGIPTIVMTAKADLNLTRQCLNHHVADFLEKPFEAHDLLKTIEDVWENPRNLTALMERFLDLHQLTDKEKEIARLALKGLSNREIATVKGNTEKTIKFHMTVIFDKCGVKSRAELFNSVFPT